MRGSHPWLLGWLAARHAILYSLATGDVLNVSYYCDGLVTKWGSFDSGGGYQLHLCAGKGLRIGIIRDYWVAG